MSTITLRLPDTQHERLKDLAAAKGVHVATATGQLDAVVAVRHRAGSEPGACRKRLGAEQCPGHDAAGGQGEHCPDGDQAPCSRGAHASVVVGLENMEAEQHRQRPERQNVQPVEPAAQALGLGGGEAVFGGGEHRRSTAGDDQQ